MFLKRLLFLSLLAIVCISCSSAKASDGNGVSQDNQAPSVPGATYASKGVMILENPTLNIVEVYRSTDGKMWDGPATAYHSALPLLKNLEGTLEQYIVIDNSSMLVSTTYGIFLSEDGWATFRYIRGWYPDSDPAQRGIGYVNGNIFAYDSDGLSVCDKECSWVWNPLKFVDQKYPDNLIGRNFKFAGVPVLAK